MGELLLQLPGPSHLLCLLQHLVGALLLHLLRSSSLQAGILAGPSVGVVGELLLQLHGPLHLLHQR